MAAVSVRVNTILLLLILMVGIAIVAMLARGARGGPLDPPGPVGSTGRTVIQTVPYTITQSGSYVLSGNLSCAACGGFADGITVNAHNVTIDLQGFELVGGPGAGSGIQTAFQNLTVRNGTIRNWPGDAIWARDSSVSRTTVENVKALANGSTGISVSDDSQIRDCLVADTTFGQGIITGHRSIITNCQVLNNGSLGIHAAGDDVTITNVVVRGNGSVEIQAGDAATLENCTADGNGTAGSGIFIGARSTLRGCTARNNGNHEIHGIASVVLEDCVADGMGTADFGIYVGENSIVRGCTARANGEAEIYAFQGTLIEDCVVDGRTPTNANGSPGGGIVVYSYSVVRGCTVTHNFAAGIYVFGSFARLESNVIHNNGGGLENVRLGGIGTACLMNQWSANTLVEEQVGNKCRVEQTPLSTQGPWINSAH